MIFQSPINFQSCSVMATVPKITMKNTHEIAVLQMASNQQCMSMGVFLLVALSRSLIHFY